MKYVTLLSGGLDSTVLLASLVKKHGKENITALTLDYGQLHSKEIEFAEWQKAYYEVPLIYKDIKSIFKGMESPLLGKGEIPEKSYAEQLAEKPGTVATYVPFRNGILLSIAAAVALDVGAHIITYGAHLDDAAGSAYPDCSLSFVEKMNAAVQEGTAGIVGISAPFIVMGMNKAAIVKRGMELGVNFNYTWSCYKGEKEPCGKCGTCIDRRKAFEANGLPPQ